jgi:hypothetical protein
MSSGADVSDRVLLDTAGAISGGAQRTVDGAIVALVS